MIIGLTGNIFSGKSTVAKFYKSRGAIVIDADRIAHSVFKKNKSKIAEIFGKNLSRREIGKIVFKNKNKLNQLCKIIHPPVINQIKSKIRVLKKNKPRALVIVDAPLLIESGLYKCMDKNIVVICPKEQLLRRAIKEGMSKKEALSRLGCQLAERNKTKYADFIINNNQSLSNLKKQVEKIYQKEVENG